MERTATCSCGQLQIVTAGDPAITVVCSCTNCQRRTGSAFGVSTYFPEQQVIETAGQVSTFREKSEAGKLVERYFCPVCGSTVYWKAEFQPNRIGVAVGCYNDPNFPSPSVSVWNKSRFSWVSLPEAWFHLYRQDPSETP